MEGEEKVQRKQDDQEEDEKSRKEAAAGSTGIDGYGCQSGFSRDHYAAGCKGYLQCMESIPAQRVKSTMMYYESKGAEGKP